MNHGLSAELVAHLAHAYALDELIVRGPLGGLSSRNVALHARQGDFVVKMLPCWATKQALLLAKRSAFVAARGLPAPAIRLTVSRAPFLHLQKNTVVLFSRLPGKILHRPQLTQGMMAQAGRTLAAFHALGALHFAKNMFAVRRFKANPKPFVHLAGPLAAAAQSDTQRRKTATSLCGGLKAKKNVLLQRRLPVPSLLRETKQLAHGDYHNENVLFSPSGELTGLLDFEQSHLGYGVIDVVHWLHLGCDAFAIGKHSTRKAKAFLSGYRSLSPLDASSLAFGVDQWMARTANSTFFEDRVTQGQHWAMPLARRDHGICLKYLQDRKDFIQTYLQTFA